MAIQAVIILARVSTWKRGQDESPARQIERGTAWALSEGMTPIEKIERVSGSKGMEDREALRYVLEMVERRKAVGVWVERVDRIGRDVIKVMTFIDSICRAGGRVWIADTGGGRSFNSADPSDRAITQMCGVMAEWQRAIGRIASIAGRKRAEDAGVHCARPIEVMPMGQVEQVEKYMKAHGLLPGAKVSWRAVSRWLWDQVDEKTGKRMGQPSRIIFTTGEERPHRPWPPATLQRAWERSRAGGVQKPNQRKGV